MVQSTYPLFYDNQSVILLMKENIFHAWMKHINIQYHYIRDIINSDEVELKDVRMDKNCVDMLTKVITRHQLEMSQQLVGLMSSA